MKKHRPLIIILSFISLVILGGVATFVFINQKVKKKPSTTPSAYQSTVPSVPVNTIPLIERPYITLAPSASTHEIIVLINQYGNAQKAELELEYQDGAQLRGVRRTINFSLETPPVEKEFPLYTKSGGGKITYHEDVNGGSLLIQYFNGQTIALKGEFSLQKMAGQEGFFSSRDAKCTFDLGQAALPPTSVVMISQTFGLPAPVEGEILAGPYAITTSQKPKGTSFELSLRLSEEASQVKLLGWTGTDWQEYPAKVSGKQLTATVGQTTTFVAINPSL